MMNSNIYSYISKLILNHFKSYRLDSCSKFHVKLEQTRQVAYLYKYLRDEASEYEGVEVGTFKLGDYTTYKIIINGINLIIAANINNIKDDYLTGLRNKLGEQVGEFEGASILFIHNTDLDSIIGGADCLFKKGMPLNTAEVRSQIEKGISEINGKDSLSINEKYLLRELLRTENSDITIEESSIFDYEVYLDILSKGKIEKNDYLNLGIFFDEGIQSGRTLKVDIKKSLVENSMYFSNISKAHLLGNIEEYTQNKFSFAGQKKLCSKKEWFNVSFEDIKKWENDKDSVEFNNYIPFNDLFTEEGFECYDITDGTTKAAKLKHSILVFNPGNLTEIKLSLKFSKKPKAEFIKPVSNITILQQQKSLLVTIKLDNSEETSYFELLYKEVKNGIKQVSRFKILILPFKSDFFTEFKSLYRINKKRLEIKTDSNLLFNPDCTLNLSCPFSENQQYELKDDVSLLLKLEELPPSDSGKYQFKLYHKKSILNMDLIVSSLKPLKIGGLDLWREKMTSNKSFLFYKQCDITKERETETITLEHNNIRYYVTGNYRSDLLLEEQIIDTDGIIYKQDSVGTLTGSWCDVDIDLRKKIESIRQYFNDSKRGNSRILPSTVYIDAELEKLYTSYINLFLEKISKITNNISLSDREQILLRLGTIEEQSNDKRIKFSPLHPLNIAYQLYAKAKIGKNEIPKEILSKLTPLYLFPYINSGGNKNEYYSAFEQSDTPEWLYYSNNSTCSQTVNRNFVPKLVCDKISEFVNNFSLLFSSKKSLIRINVVNLGDCSEILQGVFSFLIKKIKANIHPDLINPIQISIYGSENHITKFEQLSMYDSPEEIKDFFGIDLNVSKKIEARDLLRLYHEKVKFYNKGDTLSYAHISFHQFHENDLDKSSEDMSQIPSGISLGGLMSDVTSVYYNEVYRTGIGFKDVKLNNTLLKISNSLNSISSVVGTSNRFIRNTSLSTVKAQSVRNQLKELYRKSQWVTFINPNVDLNFFKEDKNVYIIHYSDQYSSSSGFDAITVTNKWEQYKDIILGHLESNNVEAKESDLIHIINMFNSVNGHWLLKLGAHNKHNQIEKEKISILSAVKEAMVILDHDDIIWVPLSLEEILRVTGAAGLRQKDGLLSKKNLKKQGEFSDDLLMIGIDISGDLKLYYYPIEVKIGNNSSTVIDKANHQGLKTYDLFKDILSLEGIVGQVYRNHFSKLILSAAQKLSLYEIWPNYSNNWNKLEKYRAELLNDRFLISNDLEKYIGKFAVISFKQNMEFQSRSIKLIDESLIINLWESDGLNDLIKSFDNISNSYQKNQVIGIFSNDLLKSKYSSKSTEKINDVIDIQEKISVDLEDSETKYTIKKPMEILFGNHAGTREQILWYPTSSDKVMHTNTGIIGTMGTGKTQFTKSLITQLLKNDNSNVDGKSLGILIFDYKGDYIKDDFVEATNASIYELYNLPYNPLALSGNSKPLLPLHTASTLQETISIAFGLGPKQKSLLRSLIVDAYDNKGINKHDKTTWNKQAPTIADVCKLYLEDDNCTVDSLHAALTELYDFQIFEPDSTKTLPLYDLIDGVTVINLNGYSPDIQNLVVAITLDLFYSQMQNNGHSKIDGNYRQLTKFILVDEADNFLGKNFSSVRKILKEGREYGVGTILSTQFLDHFTTKDNDYSSYILTWVIHRVNEIREKDVDNLFSNMSKNEKEDLVNEIKQLEKHYSIVNLAGKGPFKIKDKAFWELQNEQELCCDITM